MIVARRRRVFAKLSAHAADVRRKLPDLKIEYSIAERRHAVVSPGDDGREYFLGFASIDPLFVHQRWSHSAAAHRMTTIAVVRLEQTLAFRQRVGVLLVIV